MSDLVSSGKFMQPIVGSSRNPRCSKYYFHGVPGTVMGQRCKILEMGKPNILHNFISFQMMKPTAKQGTNPASKTKKQFSFLLAPKFIPMRKCLFYF